MLGPGENLDVRTRLVEDKADKIIIEKKVRQECDKARRTNWEEKKEKKTGASVVEFAARGTWSRISIRWEMRNATACST